LPATRGTNAEICAETDTSLATVVATGPVSNVPPLPLRSLLLLLDASGYGAGPGLVRSSVGFPVSAADQLL